MQCGTSLAAGAWVCSTCGRLVGSRLSIQKLVLAASLMIVAVTGVVLASIARYTPPSKSAVAAHVVPDAALPKLEAPRRGAPVEHRVGAAGGSFDGAGLTITFPPGALAAETTLQISSLDRPHPPLDANLKVVSAGFDLEAGSATTFAQDVSVTIPYDPAQLPAGRTEADLIGLVHVADGYRRIAPSSIDREKHRVTFPVRHFSQPAVGVLLSPGSVRRHPTLPFDVVVIKAPTVANLPDILYTSIEKAYLRLTTFAPGLATPFPAPPHGPGRLRVEITDLTEYRSRYAGGFIPSGVTPSHDLVQIDYREDPSRVPWDAAVHEFFHAIQWTLYERYRELGRPARWSGFAAESTASFTGMRLSRPFGDELVPVEDAFPFTPLTYDPFAAQDRDVSHAYQSAAFIAFLAQRYRAEAVNEVLSQVYGGSVDDRAALDAAIRALSNGKDTLDALFPEFVLDLTFRGAFGPQRIASKLQGALNLPAKFVPAALELTLADEGATVRGEVPLERKPLALAGVVEVLPHLPSGRSQRLTLTSAGKGYLWAIAKGADGAQRLLGGGASIRCEIDRTVASVIVLPVTLDEGAGALVATLGGSTGYVWKLKQIELIPAGGEDSRNETSDLASVKVTERSIALSERSNAGARLPWDRRALFTWKPLPAELVEGEPITIEVEGAASGVNPQGFVWAPIFNVDSAGDATFDVPGRPQVGFFLPLRVGFGFADHPQQAKASATITPARSGNKLSDNLEVAVRFSTSWGWGVTYHYLRAP